MIKKLVWLLCMPIEIFIRSCQIPNFSQNDQKVKRSFSSTSPLLGHCVMSHIGGVVVHDSNHSPVSEAFLFVWWLFPERKPLFSSTQAAPVSHPQELTVPWKSGIYAPTSWFSTTKVEQTATASLMLTYQVGGKNAITNTILFAPLLFCSSEFFSNGFVNFWTSSQRRDQQLLHSSIQQLPDQWLQWQHSQNPGPAGGTPHLHPPRPQGDTVLYHCVPALASENTDNHPVIPWFHWQLIVFFVS